MKNRISYGLFFLVMLTAGNYAMAAEPDTITVKVLGMHDDSRFEPADLKITAGDVVRFLIEEGVHTITAYHPDNRRPMGIPENADSFDSGPLRAGDTWYLEVQVPGVYNYFCLPHERFGHTGKINAL